MWKPTIIKGVAASRLSAHKEIGEQSDHRQGSHPSNKQAQLPMKVLCGVDGVGEWDGSEGDQEDGSGTRHPHDYWIEKVKLMHWCPDPNNKCSALETDI